jgi:tetratricopeptide (TPR) repeat protein
VKRFDHLEFDDAAPDPQPAGLPHHAPEPERDEHFWVARAREDRAAGLFEGALRYYSRALELDRNLVEGWVGQVQMLVLLAEYTEAELWARKALELFRNYPDLLAGRSQALTRLARLNDALAVSDASISQEGNSAYRWMARGDLMLARKDAVETHCFEKAALADNSAVVLLEIARIYRYYRKGAQALVWARKGVEKAPANACAWFVQGACEEDLGQLAAARRSYAQCLDIHPGHSDARFKRIALDAAGRGIKGFFQRWFTRR